MRIMSIVVSLLLMCPIACHATGTRPLQVDANLITAVDVSGSIGLHGEGFQFWAVAAALEHPDFLRAIGMGYHRRIGFSVLTWSSKGGFSIVVDWASIGSEDDAKAVARKLREASPIEQFGYTRADPSLRDPLWRRGLSTDVSSALHRALDHLDAAPFSAARSVINLCTNGPDNVSEGPERARMRAMRSDIIINGLIIGDRPELTTYFRDHVLTGPGSFVIEARQRDDVLDAMLRKFMLDLAIDTTPGGDHDSERWQGSATSRGDMTEHRSL